MDTVVVLRNLAIIIITSKVFGLFARRLGFPQVVGEIIAGIIIGPSLLSVVKADDFLSGMAEIGVILLMFSAGLETDINQLKKSGLKATVIACTGVAVPLICGAVLYMLFYGFDAPGSETFMRALFIGTILTATSVGITVQTLKELGKVSTDLGITIMSAAIIDDVIGIIVLTAVLGMSNPSGSLTSVLLRTILFFVFIIIVGYLFLQLMRYIDKKWPHTRRVPILGLAFALIVPYIADKYFGVADITGAFAAGVILSSLADSDYIDTKMNINSYMFFGPVFFASIGLQTNLRTVNPTILLFSAAFVLTALLSKIIGCGLTAKVLGFNCSDSLKVGIGMMTRGEVALIVSQRGLKAGMIDSSYFTAVILLIITSSVLTPIGLNALFTRDARSGSSADRCGFTLKRNAKV